MCQKPPPKKEVKGDNDFSTSGYFHAAEQQIEKELIKHGFKVLSREKFEAKLRKARGTVRSEGLQELTDITEVIRAAEDGDLKSDYLLQINEFTQNDVAIYEINLGSYGEFQGLMNIFPKATSKLQKIQYLPCSEFSTTLNAKLIHVQTGRIVWIGDHTASTRGLYSNLLSLRLGVEEKVSNKVEVEKFVASQNTEFGRRLRKKGDPINFPSWKVSYLVPGPIVTNGYCRIEKSEISAKSVRKELSKTVAKTLMKSIKVGGY